MTTHPWPHHMPPIPCPATCRRCHHPFVLPLSASLLATALYVLPLPPFTSHCCLTLGALTFHPSLPCTSHPCPCVLGPPLCIYMPLHSDSLPLPTHFPHTWTPHIRLSTGKGYHRFYPGVKGLILLGLQYPCAGNPASIFTWGCGYDFWQQGLPLGYAPGYSAKLIS